MKTLNLRLAILATVLLALPFGCKGPRGEGWTTTKIADGIMYYTFSGIDKVSGSAQQVFVIDQDLNNPKYELRFNCSDKREPTSDVYLRTPGCVAAMNATYESTSVVIKTDGEYYTCMPYDFVFTSNIPNWKSEGAISVENGRDVSITFDGKGKSIEERRAFYASSTSPNIFSSAPMLIDDFDPVGERFVDPKYGPEDFDKLQYEDPIRHQGVRHPRSAVAKTKDNHLLLVAVDGRRPAVSEGMSARELTRFLVKYFHPQYALNMDGGGSTTLCVRGQGDPETNVVNYPTDNEKYDHAGVRNVRTHFLVVETTQNTDIK